MHHAHGKHYTEFWLLTPILFTRYDLQYTKYKTLTAIHYRLTTNKEGGVFLKKNSLNIAKIAAAAAVEKKAKDTVILNLSKLTLIADYFVITTGDSEPQLKAINNFIMKKMKESEIRLLHCEGRPETGWILLDYGDVVVHIFSKEKREFYDLEYIWQEAKRIRLLKRKVQKEEEQ